MSIRASQAVLAVKNHLPMQKMEKMWAQSLGQEESMANHSSILTRRIPWTEHPGGLQSTGPRRVGRDWSNLACMHICQLYLNFLKTDFLRFFFLIFSIQNNCEVWGSDSSTVATTWEYLLKMQTLDSWHIYRGQVLAPSGYPDVNWSLRLIGLGEGLYLWRWTTEF